MPKYLVQTRLTPEGTKGTLKEGGTARKEAVTRAMEAMGGKVEALYYAFGQTDMFILVDLPDNATAAAVSMIGEAPGTSELCITVLVTPEEVDQAAGIAQRVSASYRAPGR
jgi:uncharacterized protein with GYD domain